MKGAAGVVAEQTQSDIGLTEEMRSDMTEKSKAEHTRNRQRVDTARQIRKCLAADEAALADEIANRTRGIEAMKAWLKRHDRDQEAAVLRRDPEGGAGGKRRS